MPREFLLRGLMVRVATTEGVVVAAEMVMVEGVAAAAGVAAVAAVEVDLAWLGCAAALVERAAQTQQ